MEIRFLNKKDNIDAVCAVYEAGWKNAYRGIIPQEFLDNIKKEKWRAGIQNPELNSFIMLDGEKIIGTASYCASRFMSMKGFGEIVSLYLLPDYWDKGYGKRLLQAAVDGLGELGYTQVFLWVLEENVRARAFYEKFGFRNSGDCLNDNIGGKDLRELRYIYKFKPQST
ncbi:GNAT family N-acetyltransferase [Anaerostipes sp.]|uniref:GNAT family N-acetyltransferase n=1 Tax=Anaerostipes sp. TaxID=1872530 RepID=UPI0025BBB762|nr:GNAT family N-acetyltransferase [Anaerostipes sp.]MBS7008773.1 GNAT family N-acetyltransferase [Anaerostipes sp.]